eukprot:6920607-Prymnesium_polylepis.2
MACVILIWQVGADESRLDGVHPLARLVGLPAVNTPRRNGEMCTRHPLNETPLRCGGHSHTCGVL